MILSGIQRTHAQLCTQIVGFLREIGLAVEERALDQETFLPGLLLDHGRLHFDPARLEYPGDLLHEAGHLAVIPRELWPQLEDEGFDIAPYETMAIPWSYAAALAVGIDPAVVFHDGGYRGKSEGLLRTFGYGVYPGAHLLEAAGMCASPSRAQEIGVPPYPHMTHWLRPESDAAAR